MKVGFLGWRVYGLGVMALGAVALAWGGFDPGQPAPQSLPGYAVLAAAAAVFMLLAGAAVEWRRTTAWAGAALAAYFGLLDVVLMHGAVGLAHPAEYGVYSSAAEQLAIAAGGLILYAGAAPIDP